MGAPKAPAPPAAQPVVPVPQPDDPRALEAQQKAQRAASLRQGATAHLLSNPLGGGTGTIAEDEPANRRNQTY